MRYTTYGNTGEKVSVVGFGGLRFDLAKSDEENAELVLHAYKKGINYFDTAPGYCNDRSETIMGIAFRKLKAAGQKDFLIATKGKPLVFDTAEKAIAAVHSSLEILGVDRIDFYHVWCLRNDEQFQLAMRPGGQMEGLLECQRKGLVKHIVFSSHQRGDSVKTVLESGVFRGVTMGINLLNFPYRWDSIRYAYENGHGVVAMNPLSGGTIPAHEKELAYLTDGTETATRLALRFNIGHPAITVTLIGFSTTDEIDEACDLADSIDTFTEEDRIDLIGRLGAAPEHSCTGCGYCKVCPKGINIPGYMLFYNEKILFGISDDEMADRVYGLEYWNYSANSDSKADGCVSCGKCEVECTQHLPIIDRLKEIATWENSRTDGVTV